RHPPPFPPPRAPDLSARAVFGPSAAVIAGSGAPDGRAERVPGGYRVQGRWRYASGAPYATTVTANCIVTRGGEPVRGDDGEPLRSEERTSELQSRAK